MQLTSFKYGKKDIRVSWDTDKKKLWFVVEDVLIMVYTNPSVFWNKLKKEISSSNKGTSTYYTTVNTNQGTIDVADVQQIKEILKTIPNRKAKKNNLLNWVNNPIPPKITELVSIALSDGLITATERNNIIAKAEKAGISTEYINQYINTAIVQCKLYTKHEPTPKPKAKQYEFNINSKKNRIEVNEKEEPSNDGCLLLFAISFIELLLMMSGGISIVVFMILILVQFFAYGLIIEKKYPDIVKNKSFYEYNTTPYYKKAKTSYSKPTIPPSIKEWIRAALKNNILSFAKRTEIVNAAVESGVDRMLINLEINTAIRKRLQSFKRDKLSICKRCAELIPNDIGQCPFCGKEDIWNTIKNLTRLALADRVLTDLERETIVNKAEEGGISKEEINKYLDEQLNLRLKSYTKVDLRDCPYCGAQIPLISDECMYCGKPLEHIEGDISVPFKISGYEADIIRSENQRIEEERHNIKNCPDCGAPFPLISNICESCGHVLHERDENSLNIQNLLNNIQRSIERVTDAPKPKVYQIIGYWFYYIILSFSIFAFIVGIISDNEAGKIISVIGFIFGIALMATNAILFDNKSPVLISDGEYYKARHAYEMYTRQVNTLYGDNHEAQTLLRHFATLLKRLKRERYQNRRKVGNIILIVGVVIMSIITYFGTSEGKAPTAPSKPAVVATPHNTAWALTFHKKLEPYPPENGVESRLEPYLRAVKDAELTFVMAADYDSAFYWKVNKVELTPSNYKDYYHFQDDPLDIQLLDSNFHAIGTLSEGVVSNHPNFGFHDVMSTGKNHYYADFWSKHQTASDTVMKTIAQKAAYYTIYSTKQ